MIFGVSLLQHLNVKPGDYVLATVVEEDDRRFIRVEKLPVKFDIA